MSTNKRVAFIKSYLSAFSTIIDRQSPNSVAMVIIRCDGANPTTKAEQTLAEDMCSAFDELARTHQLNAYVPMDGDVLKPIYVPKSANEGLEEIPEWGTEYGTETAPEGYQPALVWKRTGSVYFK